MPKKKKLFGGLRQAIKRGIPRATPGGTMFLKHQQELRQAMAYKKTKAKGKKKKLAALSKLAKPRRPGGLRVYSRPRPGGSMLRASEMDLFNPQYKRAKAKNKKTGKKK